MIDPRFYALLGPKPLSEIARIVGASILNSSDHDHLIETCAPLGEAQAGALAFCQSLPRYGELIATAASACLVRQEGVKRLPTGVVPLVVGNPRAVFAKAANALVERKEIGVNGPGIAPDAKLEETVRTGIGVVIGSGAHIGAGTSIGPNSVIGPGVAIGRNCRIGANVVIYCALIGDRVTIASGSVIGESGFGVAPTPEGPVDVPQLGRVIIQDDVSIGSLCAVDRGAFGDTIVGLGCKIDNFTQIAHNCVLGRGVVIAAFGGISGSSEIGDNVLMGGRVGVGDHFKVGAGAVLGAASGVLQDVPAGEAWSGYPARPLRQWMRETIALKKLAQAKPAKKSE